MNTVTKNQAQPQHTGQLQKTLRPAIFLDRDGTLNRDTGYVCRQEDWHWLPGVPEALRRLRAAGFLLVVVSNQSGLARGLFDMNALEALEAHANESLAAVHAGIDAWYYCPHLPDITEPCQCRKPQPGLLLRAAADLDIDLAASWMIGDRLRDVQAGLAAGCQAILLHGPGTPPTPEEEEAAPPPGVAVAAHLPAAVVQIMAPRMRQVRARLFGCGKG